MTSTPLVYQQIKKFLSTTEPEVLCISGSWGIGKTYAWKTLLKSQIDKKLVTSSRYSYVSLFGINSLEDLRRSIVGNLEFLQDEGASDLEARAKNWFNRVSRLLHDGRGLVGRVPFVGQFVEGGDSILFQMIRKQIVCVDDVERRGKELSIRDTMGLISFLKEERQCKVVLILNDGALDTSDQLEFNKHSDKVIDVGLRFLPEPTESAAIALTEDNEIERFIRQFSIALRISNIRLIKRIERHAKSIEATVSHFDYRVRENVVRSIAVLVWATHYPDKGNPLDYLLNKRQSTFWGASQENKTEEEALWDQLLEDCDFTTMDEFDLEILNGIKNGFMNIESLTLHAKKFNEQVANETRDGSFDEAWRAYHDSFDENAPEVLENIYLSFKKNVQSISPINLNGTVILFKELGEPDRALELLKYYMDNRVSELKFWDLANYPFEGDIADADVRAAFAQRFKELDTPADPVSALLHISKEHSWSNREIEALAALSSTEFMALFKKFKGKELSRIVRAALDFGRMSGATPDMIKIYHTAKEALEVIGQESEINARRVRKFGVVVEQESSEKDGKPPK